MTKGFNTNTVQKYLAYRYITFIILKEKNSFTGSVKDVRKIEFSFAKLRIACKIGKYLAIL